MTAQPSTAEGPEVDGWAVMDGEDKLQVLLYCHHDDWDRKETFENPDDLFPTIYRVDRIISFRETGERFHPAYSGRFQEGEFRKRVQFMYGGRLETIRFRYIGPSIEAVLDRLPTAEIIQEDDEGWTVQAEVFGKGVEMWLRSQGNYVGKNDKK